MALAHFFVRGERLNPIKAAGFVVGFGGLATLMGPEALLELRGQGTELLYQLAVLGGAVCYAINAILARHRPPADPLVASAGVMLAGSVMMLPIGAVPASAELILAPLTSLVAMLALSIVATAIATVVFLKLVTVAGPSFTSFINYLIPVWALLMGVVLLGEQPGTRVMVALALILSGIALSEIGSRSLIARQARQDA
jgi:drug/metabolite transporter (DMT)-like permease